MMSLESDSSFRILLWPTSPFYDKNSCYPRLSLDKILKKKSRKCLEVKFRC